MGLSKIQKSISKLSKQKGYNNESLNQKFMLLFEEVGELAKSVRKRVGTKSYSHSKTHRAEEEVVDVLYVLIDICNKLNIDLEKEFVKKIKKIEER